MKFRRRYVLISWNDIVGVGLTDVMRSIEKALGPTLTTWQRPLLIYADEQRKELIVRMPHCLVPRFKKLFADSVNIAGRDVHLHVLYVSGTLKGVKEKLSKMRAHSSSR